MQVRIMYVPPPLFKRLAFGAAEHNPDSNRKEATMFSYYMLLATTRLFLAPADALTLGPPCTNTNGLPQPRTTQDEPEAGPITRWQAPTYALALFDERLSRLSAARSVHSGCTGFDKPAPDLVPSLQPDDVTETRVVEAVTVRYDYVVRRDASRLPQPGLYSRRRTRPVEPTGFQS
ncbi:hypothetical protein VTH06DRAFT_3141 [Thermothelomyces fergusii]